MCPIPRSITPGLRAFAHSPLIANPLTPEPGSPRFFNLQWWLLGHLAYDTPLGPNGAYQILRLLALAAFAAALAVFCTAFARPQRAWAFTLVMLSGGFGWALVLAKSWTGELRNPLSVQIAEANTVFSAMAFPHLLVAGALTLTIFSACFQATGARRGRWLTLIVVATLALGFSHGYDLIPTLLMPGIAAAVTLVKYRRWPRLAAPVIALAASAAPPALYALSLTRLDSTWRDVLAQYGNAGVFTPPPPQLIILLGLPLLLALWQLRPAAWQAAEARQRFVRIWFVFGFALIYIPTNYQIKMLTTYQVPVCLLAAQTWLTFQPWLVARSGRVWRGATPRWLAPALATALVLFVTLTNLYLTSWRILDLHRARHPYYLTAGDVQALTTIGEVAQPGQIVLAAPDIGLFVPVYADARPFVAHWAQTLDFFARRDTAMRAFAADTPESDRRQILAANGIAFVIAGPTEGVRGGSMPPPWFGLEQLGATTATPVHGSAVYRVPPTATVGAQP